MSRGLGKVQRRVLEVLADDQAHRLQTLPCEVFGVSYRERTAAQCKSVARAVRGLEERGLVTSCYPIKIDWQTAGRSYWRHRVDELTADQDSRKEVKRCQSLPSTAEADNT